MYPTATIVSPGTQLLDITAPPVALPAGTSIEIVDANYQDAALVRTRVDGRLRYGSVEHGSYRIDLPTAGGAAPLLWSVASASAAKVKKAKKVAAKPAAGAGRDAARPG